MVSTTDGWTGDGTEWGEGELYDVFMGGMTFSSFTSGDSLGGGAGGGALDNCTSASANSAC